MSENRPQAERPHSLRFLPVLFALFAASGCSALIYEIVWYQLLQLVIGGTAVSLAVLLTTFMGGLCLGSIVLPRILTARRHHPLRVYAVIESAIGVSGILVLFGMPLVSRIYVMAVARGLSTISFRAAVCSMFLLVPTILMGASLPAVARWLEATPRGASYLGLLYGANTVGAVVGCLLAGFYLLRIFDMTVASYLAVSINFTVALVSFYLSRQTPDCTAEVAPVQSPVPRASNVSAVCIVMALSGASALGAEVIWTRLLGLILGASVYTFSVVLAVFLVGIALGSVAGSILSRFVNPQKALGYCQFLLVAAMAWTAFMLAKSVPYWPANPKLPISLWMHFQIDFLRATSAILPPTLFWGASFSLAVAAATVGDADPARPVAAIYASNTAGAIAGALAVSVLLIPRIGTRQSQRLLMILSLLSALCALSSLQGSRPWRSIYGTLRFAVLVLLAAILAAGVPEVPPQVVAYGRLVTVSGGSKILYVGEGINSSIAVSQFGNMLQFHVSGKSEASTGPYDMRVQRMLGDLPALFDPNPRSALVVGFGAGVTAGSLVVNPDIQRIVICEIEPLVPPATARYFRKQNYNVLNDRRTKVIFDDARSYILTTPDKFDIVTSDPIHPWVKGSAALYTREYFELVKKHLNPGGVVAQWVPLYETDLASVKSAIATFFEVFPNGTIWGNQGDGEGYDLVLLGQNEAFKADGKTLQERLDRPDYADVVRSLREVGLESAFKIFQTFAGRASDLRPWLKDAEINRDRNLRLQYLAGLALNSSAEGKIYDEILSYRRNSAAFGLVSDW